MKRLLSLIYIVIFALIQSAFSQHVHPNQLLPKVEIWQKFELGVENNNSYADPIRDVELAVELKAPDGRIVKHFGFYDEELGWKFRFSPHERGRWDYKAKFSDGSVEVEGAFVCIPTQKMGRVRKNRYNPFWLGTGDIPKTLFRSFHVGDRFFAENWDDPMNPDDGEKRTRFLDWLQENKYNMLSIASHFTNRDEVGRGKDWVTPKVWPINPKEYRKMEAILDELLEREIAVFPFAGFFGARGNWPTDWEEQQLYIKYVLARIGHYPNIILNVAGPEPFWRENKIQYKNAMRIADINRLGAFIKEHDVHNHVLTVHNEKRATQFGDPFIDYLWCDMSTIQGPTTSNRVKLYSGLIMNHRPQKPCYAQETLWVGNKWHPNYSATDIRRNTLTILFSGSVLNFAHMDGNSSSGFSGIMDFEHLYEDKHKEVRRVWDWFETIPFHRMLARPDMTKFNAFCLAEEGVEYFIYMDSTTQDQIQLDYPYSFETQWINARDFSDLRNGESINKTTNITTPNDGGDWIFHAVAPRPNVVAKGHFPDIATDFEGNIHLVYNRKGLYYKKYNALLKKWEYEIEIGCACENVKRSDPDIVVDSKGNPAVYCGQEFAWFDGEKWNKSKPGSKRDTELAIDSKDNIYLVHRGGNNGGFIGLKMKPADKKQWIDLNDPDKGSTGSNDHVYSDIFIDSKNGIHLVQRHGPEVEVTYRYSADGGVSWSDYENVMDERGEGPHIVVNSNNVPFISTGKSYVLERTAEKNWESHGRKMKVYSRMQPELGIDKQDNVYLTSWGGHYNILNKGMWMGEKRIEPFTEASFVGFVETVGSDDFAYVVWEEGSSNDPDKGMNEDAQILVGILFPDGRLIGIY